MKRVLSYIEREYPHTTPISQIHNSFHNILQGGDDVFLPYRGPILS